MNVGRSLLAAVAAIVCAGGSALAASLPVYPGAVPDARGAHTVTHCGHQVTETQYHLSGSPSIDSVMSYYGQRIPGSVRISLKMGDAVNNSVFDPSGTRAVSLIGEHLLTFLTYNPPVGAAGVAVMKRASAGDKAAYEQLAHCKA